MKTYPTSGYWALLAITRFMLSMIVFIGHLEGVIGETYFTHRCYEYGELAAVIGFFIISGFSIANSIERRPQRYLLRRFWRIWPTYLFSFFFCTLPTIIFIPYGLNVYFKNQNITVALILGNLFMLQGLLVPVIEANAAVWTLAIEEWCYLFAPLFKRCRSWIICLLIVGSACCYANAQHFGWVRFAGQINGIGHLSFIWAWLLGFFFYKNRSSVMATLILLFLPVWLICGANELGGSRSAFTLLAATFIIAFGEQIVSLTNNFSGKLVNIKWKEKNMYPFRCPEIPPASEFLESYAGECVKEKQSNEVNGYKNILLIEWKHIKEAFIFLGNVSYPLYIIHYPLFFLLFMLTGCRNHWIYGFSVFLLSIIVYFVIDKPNRKRWEPRY